MASGDIFADMYSTGTYSVQPALGVQVCITHIFTNDSNAKFKPQNSGGTMSLNMWNNGGAGQDDRIGYTMGRTPMKIFITNSEYFQLNGTQTGYTGIEM